MDQELKDSWVAALRSGDYTQSFGSLRDDDGYCCLGVLCEVSGVGRWEKSPDMQGYSYLYEEKRNGGYFRRNLANRLGIDDCLAESFANMNDGGRTFGEIADEIETKLLACQQGA